MFRDAMDHLRTGLLVCVFDITDRVQHTFWRYEDPRHPARPTNRPEGLEDPFLKTYRMADALLGEVQARMDPESLLLVISDHGFRSFRRCVNLNTWLHRNGFLFFRRDVQPGEWFRGVDWSRTRAFALGLAGIYVNQKGRESHGIVEPGAEKERLKQEIIGGLTGIKDPATGEPAICEVVDARQAYHGPYAAEAPDLVVAYHEGYRHAWESAIGRVAEEVFTDNRKSWSGDHCLLPNQVPGVFFADRKFTGDRPRLLDLAPTLLRAFGIRPPEYMDGKALEMEP